MNGTGFRVRVWETLPWAALGLALILATEPAWRIPLLGFSPGLDEVLLIGRCLSPSP